MADKMRQINVLLQALSRVPGLSFLSQAEYRLQDAVDAVDDVNDVVEENQRHLTDVRDAVVDISTSEEEEEQEAEQEEEV
jgi:hypothetical protein